MSGNGHEKFLLQNLIWPNRKIFIPQKLFIQYLPISGVLKCSCSSPKNSFFALLPPLPKVIGDSYEIVQYLDRTYPSPSLKPPGNDEAEKVTGNVFNIFSAWAKNQDKNKDAELEANFTAELKNIDEFLAQSKGPLLCGEAWSVADCALVPRLYHIRTVAHYYKNYTRFNDFDNLKKYMEYTFATPEFKATDYPTEWVVAGWAKFFQ